MFRTHQFIATCAAIIALGTTASAAAPETRREEDVSAAMVSAPTAGAEIVQTSDLHAFTHIAYIPANADLSTIRIGSVKMVKIAHQAAFCVKHARLRRLAREYRGLYSHKIRIARTRIESHLLV